MKHRNIQISGYGRFPLIADICIAWAGIAGFLPPPAENLSVDEVYQYFTDNNLRIRIGMALTLIVTPLYFIFGSATSKVLARIEGPSATMSQTELLGAFGTVVVTWDSCVAWLAAAFDTPHKSPQDIKAMSDLAWMWFNPTAMVSFVQFIAFGIVCLVDKTSNPLIPRWMGWFSFAMGATLLLALLTPFFRTGPFAWHGLFCYYVGLGGYFLWILFATHFVIKAIKRLESETVQ